MDGQKATTKVKSKKIKHCADFNGTKPLLIGLRVYGRIDRTLIHHMLTHSHHHDIHCMMSPVYI